jgi:putative tricarboxylic transport membrane protein
MIATSLHGLWYGFSIALQPHNLMWSFIGVLIGNMIGVLPGMGPLATISILLPLTYAMSPVSAVLMIAGIYYGSQYGGAICSILLNLPCHAPHAVTCIDGYPLTKMGKGGMALGVAMLSSLVGASFGICLMVFFSPLLVSVAFKFGPAERFSVMLLGLLAGGTMAKGSPLKGVAMTLFGLLLGTVGVDPNTGTWRFSFGFDQLSDGVELVGLAMGLFGIAEFLKNVNRLVVVRGANTKIRLRDMRPSKTELKQSLLPMIRGTLIGSVFGILPGTGPTIASFTSYATEKKLSKNPERFGHGAIEGVAAPEASTHSATQCGFIPTMTMGIPSDGVMALLLGALLIQNITPGPELITDHPDIFWGLIASFWIGNIILIFLNVPLIGLWVKMLAIPFRFLYPSALFFICIGVYSTNNDLFSVGEALVFGLIGYLMLVLEFEPAPVLLGLVLGPLVEENFRRAAEISRGNLSVFIDDPISAGFLIACILLIVYQLITHLPIRSKNKPQLI